MSATLTVSHRSLGMEVRRGAYQVELDGTPVGSVEMNDSPTGTAWRLSP